MTTPINITRKSGINHTSIALTGDYIYTISDTTGDTATWMVIFLTNGHSCTVTSVDAPNIIVTAMGTYVTDVFNFNCPTYSGGLLLSAVTFITTTPEFTGSIAAIGSNSIFTAPETSIVTLNCMQGSLQGVNLSMTNLYFSSTSVNSIILNTTNTFVTTNLSMNAASINSESITFVDSAQLSLTDSSIVVSGAVTNPANLSKVTYSGTSTLSLPGAPAKDLSLIYTNDTDLLTLTMESFNSSTVSVGTNDQSKVIFNVIN